MSYSPITVANYFIKQWGENGNLTPMKLIKLTYIANCWYLTLSKTNRELINEDAQAWDYGPVIPSLYFAIRENGSKPIKKPITSNSNEQISESDAEFLNVIWKKYGNMDGLMLSAITHVENTPWSKTYPLGNNLKIDKNLIIEHYKSLKDNSTSRNNSQEENKDKSLTSITTATTTTKI